MAGSARVLRRRDPRRGRWEHPSSPGRGLVLMKRSIKAAIAAAAVLALAACAPSAPEEGSDEAAGTDGGGGATDETLTIATTTEVVNLNPLLGNRRTDSWVTDLMYPRLLTSNADGSKEPYLATEWGYSDDGMTAFYEIRDDFVWSDG